MRRSTKLCGKAVDVGRERICGHLKNPLGLFLCRVEIRFSHLEPTRVRKEVHYAVMLAPSLAWAEVEADSSSHLHKPLSNQEEEVMLGKREALRTFPHHHGIDRASSRGSGKAGAHKIVWLGCTLNVGTVHRELKWPSSCAKPLDCCCCLSNF